MAVTRNAAMAALLAAALTACGPTVRNHGYVPEPEALALVTVGVDTMETVAAAVGRPSTAGVLRDDAWYYVQETRRRFGPTPARPIAREVVAISFAGPGGAVSNVERFGLEDGRVVALSRRVTETTIRDFGLIQQLIRNFGRIDVGQTLADGA